MTVVKHLADEGLTICATIHSPSPTAFQLFDRMLLLLSGQVAYFGPRGAHCMLLSATACMATKWPNAALYCSDHTV
jgi:ABC-type multidrug transport system ATPase subunit